MPSLASPLLTDLYQLNMVEAYLADGETRPAVFEFLVRRLPDRRGFLVAAGLEQVLDYLEAFHFPPDELRWLASTMRFSPRLLDYLAELRFTGEVHAMPEGTVFFGNEPILRVVAALPEAQLIETRLINLLHFETLIASKAARMVLAAEGKQLVDFGFRRAHGAEAGLLAARASYIAGFAGTATVEAERQFGIPTFGTMAHSFIEACDDEATAFERFARARPEHLTLLLDTYDTIAAALKVVGLAPKLAAAGIAIRAVRIDSGGPRGPVAQRPPHPRRGRPRGRIDFGERWPGRGRHRGADRGEGADRRLRRRHQPDHVRGRADARLRLQAPGICRSAASQAVARQGELPGRSRSGGGMTGKSR
jgi:nicotinate phosphoribosyltransferase